MVAQEFLVYTANGVLFKFEFEEKVVLLVEEELVATEEEGVLVMYEGAEE